MRVAALALVVAAFAVSLLACGGRELAPPSSAPPPTPGAPSASGHTWRVVPAESRVVVHVATSGLVGHDHMFVPQKWSGTVWFDPAEPAATGMDLTFAAEAFHDEQPQLSEESRKNEVDPTARGPEVLDAARYAEVRFVGRRVLDVRVPADPAKPRSMSGTVVGTLVMHGRQQEVSAPVSGEWTDARLHASGTASVLQTSFGIQPMNRIFGLLAVKDALKVTFDIVAVAEAR